ncbi:MAG: patatin-like phospholipase family protein [Cyclobacteriaceae bacterium]|nr:patatin-like phospholipase family protein [Cyclobacteriaceae bacterium]
MTKKYKTGIVLGGGGARGFAHLGVLKALEEKGIKPDVISGVSAGALAGVFIAEGLGPEEVMKIMKDHKFTDYTKVIMPVNGLLSLENLEDMLKKHIQSDDFDDLQLPFFTAVSNLYTGKVEYRNSGSLIKSVMASVSIPVLFSPVIIEDSPFVDGGLLDNLPITPLEDICEKIIAVSISPVQEISKMDNILRVAARTFQLSVNNQSHKKKEICDVFIEPPALAKYDILDTTHADELFEIGYGYCKELNIDF